MLASLSTFSLYCLRSGYVEVIINGFIAFMSLLFKNTGKNYFWTCGCHYFMTDSFFPFSFFFMWEIHLIFRVHLSFFFLNTELKKKLYIRQCGEIHICRHCKKFTAYEHKIQSGICFANKLGFNFILYSFQIHTSNILCVLLCPSPPRIIFKSED